MLVMDAPRRAARVSRYRMGPDTGSEAFWGGGGGGFSGPSQSIWALAVR